MFTVWDIYTISNLTPLPKFTSNSRNTKFKDSPQWNISQMIAKTIHPFRARIAISCTMKRVFSLLWVWGKDIGNKDNSIRISQWRRGYHRRNTGVRRSKRVSIRDPSSKVNHLNKVVWKNHFYQFHQIRPCTKKKMVIDKGKRSKISNDVQSFENIDRNPLSFLKVSFVQKEVPPSHKLQDK